MLVPFQVAGVVLTAGGVLPDRPGSKRRAQLAPALNRLI
jgi:hypothetical protein